MNFEWLSQKSEKLWYIRGFVFALSLTTLFSSSLDWTNYEFLRASHALILSWATVSSAVAASLQSFFLGLKITGGHVNAVVLLVAVTVPSFVLSYIPSQSLIYRSRYILAFLFVSTVVIFWGGYIFNDYTSPIISLIVLSPIIFPQLRKILIAKPAFGKGTISFIIFLSSLEVLYYLSSPELKQSITNWSCTTISKVEGKQCKELY